MPLPRKTRLDTTTVHKSDVVKQIATELENAKRKLVAAQESMNVAQIKKLQQIVADLTGTIERNS